MKVARATQVLSSSVCLALLSLVYAKELPDSARSTAYFCDRMDKLFDSLNSCCPKKTEQKLRYAIGKGKSELIELTSRPHSHGLRPGSSRAGVSHIPS